MTNPNHNSPGAGEPDDDTPMKNLGIAGNLTRAFIKSPLTPLFLIAAFAFGLVALLTLPREEEPQISVPMVDIIVQAPGLRADDAQKLISEPLETIVKSINGVEHIYSQSMDNMVMVTARFLVGTSSDTAVLRVHDKVRANIDRIPVGIAEPKVVGRGIDDVAIVTLTFSPTKDASGHVGPNDLTRIVREVRNEVAKVEDVGLTYVVGETNEIIRISPQPEKLALYGITLQQLAGKVGGANTAMPASQVREQGRQIDVIAGETLSTPAEIGNLLLTARDGRPVYVRDVATIDFATDTSEALVSTLRKDGETVERVPSVTLAIAKRAGSNAVVVAETILQRVEALEGKLIPEDIRVEVTRNYGETADEKANELLYHLGAGDDLDRSAGLAGDRLARGAGGGHRHSGDNPADSLCGTRHGLHAEPRQPFRAHLLHRHPRRRRDRRDREHRPALGDGRRALAPPQAPSRPSPRSAIRPSSRP